MFDRPTQTRWRRGRLSVEEDPPLESNFPALESERPIAAGQVLIVMVVGLVLGALLNATEMADRAEQKSFDDPWRDVSLTFWGGLETVADAVGLTRPRAEIESALGRDDRDRTAVDVSELLARAPDRDRGAGGNGPGNPTATFGERTSGERASGESTGTGSPTGPPVATAPRIRTPTAAAPLRLYVGGDSIAKNFGLEMAQVAGSTGIIEPAIDYRVLSGLTRPDVFNWPQHLADDVVPTDPEIMILLFGANDAQGIKRPDGTVCPRFDRCWIDEYRRRVAGTMDLLRDPDGDRIVLWLGQPMPGPDTGLRYLDLLNAIYAEAAAPRPWIRYVDTWNWFLRPDGTYSAYLDAADGTEQRVRDGDDVHFTPAGGSRLGWAIVRLVGDEIVDLSAWSGTPPRSSLPGTAPAPRTSLPPATPRLVD